MRIVSWNMAHRPESWRFLKQLGPDIALVQEACEPPPDVKDAISCEECAWETSGTKRRRWRTSVSSFGPRLQRIETVPLSEVKDGNLGVSRPGTLAAAHVQIGSE